MAELGRRYGFSEPAPALLPLRSSLPLPSLITYTQSYRVWKKAGLGSQLALIWPLLLLDVEGHPKAMC